MPYLLDTNACIEYLKRRSPALTSRVLSQNPSEVFLCSVVRAELVTGHYKNRRPRNAKLLQDLFTEFASFPFDDAAADKYAEIRVDLELRGLPIGPNDLMIAAIALTNSVVLVTHNTAEFRRVPGLVIEDWQVP